MITFRQGDILESSSELIVIPVNTKGVMGKGLALQSKRKYFDNYAAYRGYALQDCLKPGGVFLHVRQKQPHFIANLATKDHWRADSKLEYVERGIGNLIKLASIVKVTTIAIPALGSGLGGLYWDTVKATMVDLLQGTSFAIEIYEPTE